MADTSQPAGDGGQAAAASSSEDSRTQGVQARPFHCLASAILAFFDASHARPVWLLPCPADVALGVSGAAAEAFSLMPDSLTRRASAPRRRIAGGVSGSPRAVGWRQGAAPGASFWSGGVRRLRCIAGERPARRPSTPSAPRGRARAPSGCLTLTPPSRVQVSFWSPPPRADRPPATARSG